MFMFMEFSQKKLVKQRGVLSILGHGRVKGMIKQNEIGKTKKKDMTS